MGRTSNTVKQQWNAAHYTQIKISVKPELASAFKNSCVAADVSIASVLSQYMMEHCYGKSRKKVVPDYTERRKRRVAVNHLIGQLSLIIDAEQNYLASIPENLQGSSLYENAEHTVSVLEEATDLLESAY